MTTRAVLPRKPADPLLTEIVAGQLRQRILRAELRPGQQLPPERELAARLGVSRTSVRAGIASLAAKGVLVTRHGAGTFVADGPPVLDSEPLAFLAALHGFTRREMFEARRVLEVGAAGLAALRADGGQLAAMSEEVTEMFAALQDPQGFLLHDIRFHRAVASASGNPILASLVEMVSALFYDQRRKTAARAANRRGPAEYHRRIYRAIRERDRGRAEQLMAEHLLSAEREQQQERDSPRGPGKSAGGPRRRRRTRAPT
jgi:GntR family transcriptional regulator, transcriptional repressor for pyruvate dehydrogenase complex